MPEASKGDNGPNNPFPLDGGGVRIPEAHPTNDLVSAYLAFQEALNPLTEVVYHPCSGVNSSPSFAFPNSRVIYAEWGPHSDEYAKANVTALRAAGLEAHNEDARHYDPGPVDVVILLNPTIAPEGPVANLKPGGYALVNEYHGTASDLHRDERFELQGIIYLPVENSDEPAVFDGENPESYWEHVETDEEFRASPNYGFVGMLSKDQTGTETPTMGEYIEAAKRVRELHPDATETDGYLFYKDESTGMPRLFPCSLPSKKPVRSNDFFVFQRKA